MKAASQSTYEPVFEAIALFLKAEVTLVAEAAFQRSGGRGEQRAG